MPFSPSDLSGLAIWLDASQLGLADGAAVPQLSDLSGNGRHVTQATGSLQPLCRTGQLLGGRIVRFDGVDDYLLMAPFSWPAEQTVCLLGKANDAVPALDGYLNIGTGASRVLQLRQQDAASVQTAIFDSVGTAYSDNNPAAPQTWLRISAVHSTTAIETFVEGTSDGPTAITGSPATPNVNFLLGCGKPNPTQYGNVDIAEVVVYDHALSTVERQQVESYLSAKWIALPPAQLSRAIKVVF